MPDTKKNDHPRQLLASVRRGDYAHSGKEEAIDLVLNSLNAFSYPSIKVLDTSDGLK